MVALSELKRMSGGVERIVYRGQWLHRTDLMVELHPQHFRPAGLQLAPDDAGNSIRRVVMGWVEPNRQLGDL